MFENIARGVIVGIVFVCGCMVATEDASEPALAEAAQEITMACQHPRSIDDCETCNGNNTCHVCCDKLATADQKMCNADCEDVFPPPKPVPVPTTKPTSFAAGR